MGKILIANVGNRTLIMKGEEDERIEYDTKKVGTDSFREATKVHLEMIELDASCLDALDSNIIDEVIKKEDTIDCVYLFTSDQTKENEKQKRKDTLYAGDILSNLLLKKYDRLKSVKNIVLKGVNAVNLNELTARFRKELLQIVNVEHPNRKFIICDSGGTPHQKNALKIVAEYYLNETDVEFYQVTEDEDDNGIIGKSHAKKQDFYQIRKIADAQNISLLIKEGEYAAAAHVGKKTQSQTIQSVLWLMHYRLLLREEDAKKHILNGSPLNDWTRLNPNFSRQYPSVLNYLKQEPTGDYTNWLSFTNKNFFRLCEILEIGKFYYFRNDWSNVVLSYHIFIETFVNFVSKDYGYNGSKDLTYKIKFLELQILNQALEDFIIDFKQLNSHFTGGKPLNKLRNQIAHEGKGVIREEIESVIPNFFTMIKTWHNRFSVSDIKEDNVFIKVNQSLHAAMQMQEG
jgi:hypothetical protein